MENQLDHTIQNIKNVIETINDPQNIKLLKPSSSNPDEMTGLEFKLQLKIKILEDVYTSLLDVNTGQFGPSLIGFLGHFSSGKSSLINGILQIQEGESPIYKRKTDSHPTDTGITFICHQNQYVSFKNRKFFSIDNIQIEPGPIASVLNNIVLVDTPGLGNEKGEHDLAERVLNLCHVVILTIDGGLPFAHKDDDFQLLDKAINKLSDIPKIFVVTKSSNFLNSRKGDFNSDFNQLKADDWWQKILSRINADARFQKRSDEIKIIPHFFIDSIDHYNMDVLIKEIRNYSIDSSQRTRVYNAQVNYLKAVANESLDSILSYLIIREQNLDDFYREANKRAEETQSILIQKNSAIDSSIQTIQAKINEFRNKINPEQSYFQIPNPESVIIKSDSYQLDLFQSSLKKESEIIKKHIYKDIERRIVEYIDNEFSLFSRLENIKLEDFEIDLPVFFSELNEQSERMNIQRDAMLFYNASVDQILSSLNFHRINLSLYLEHNSFEELTTVIKQTMTGGVGQYTHSYIKSANSFLAYIIQPSSKKILTEYGLVLFTDLSNNTKQIPDIKPSTFESYLNLDNTNSSYVELMNKIKMTHNATIRDLNHTELKNHISDFNLNKKDIDTLVLSAAFGSDFSSRLKEFFSQLQEEILISEKQMELCFKELKNDSKLLWLSRLDLLGRFTLFYFLLIVIGKIDWIEKFLTERISEITVNLAAAVIFSVFSYLFFGNITRLKDIVSIKKSQISLIFTYFKKRNESKQTLIQSSKNKLHNVLSNSDGQDIRDVIKNQVQGWFVKSAEHKLMSKYYNLISSIQTETLLKFNEYSASVLRIIDTYKSEVRNKADESCNKFVSEQMNLILGSKEKVRKFKEHIQEQIKTI